MKYVLAFLVVALLIFGCPSQGPVCNEPYILVGDDCCLDNDGNNVCDKDQQTAQQTEKQTTSPTCNPPYILVGSDCCLDADDNKICDSDETEPQQSAEKEPAANEPQCGAPYIMVGNLCCLDKNGNDICDTDESEPEPEPEPQPQQTVAVCGNGACESGESSVNCCDDCGCQTGYSCVSNSCEQDSVCGDGVCSGDESSDNCCEDCECNAGFYCDETCKTQFQFAPMEFQFVLIDLCGNGVCGDSEDSTTCCTDCGCPITHHCEENVCVEGMYIAPIIMQAYIVDAPKETIISEGSGNYYPIIYGDRIVWQQYQAGGKPQVNMYDLNTKTINVISDTWSSMPDIWEDKMVWEDGRRSIGDNVDVYYLDLGTTVEGMISPRESYQRTPSVYNNQVAWVEQTSKGWDAYVYDFSERKEYRLTSDKDVTQNPPRTWAGWVVWSQADHSSPGNSQYEIVTYHLPTKKKETIYSTNSPHEVEYSTGIDNGRIAFIAGSNGNEKTYVYDISTKLLTQVSTIDSDKKECSIQENRVVWADKRNGNWDIYMYDLSSKEETQITDDSTDQEHPDVYGSTIVYHGLSETQTGKHIFKYELD